MVGSGVSYNQLLSFVSKHGLYIDLARPMNVHESIGGLFSNNLLIDFSIDGSIRPIESLDAGNDAPKIYRSFLIKCRDSPVYTAFEYTVDSMDMLRGIISLARDYLSDGGAHIVYFSGDEYRLRLVTQRRFKKYVSESLSNMQVDWDEVGVYDVYSGLPNPIVFRDRWGGFYIYLFKDIQPGTLISSVGGGVLYYGDFHRMIYLVFSREPITNIVSLKSIYYEDGAYSYNY